MVVVPDGCREREESLDDAGGDALGAVSAVTFEAELPSMFWDTREPDRSVETGFRLPE